MIRDNDARCREWVELCLRSIREDMAKRLRSGLTPTRAEPHSDPEMHAVYPLVQHIATADQTEVDVTAHQRERDETPVCRREGDSEQPAILLSRSVVEDESPVYESADEVNEETRNDLLSA